MGYTVFVASHIGNSRENHEDNYLLGRQYMSPEQVKSMAEHRRLYSEIKEFSDDFCVAVSDGMGGYECGEVASLMTVKYLADHYEDLLDTVKSGGNKLSVFVTDLNNYVCREAEKKPDTRNMGATLCGVICTDGKVTGFNVGDSRLYQYSNGILKQISVDNTEGQRLLGLGLLSEEEVKTFPKKKAIYKYIGKDTELIPDLYDLGDITKNSMLLLCSDGLSDVLDMEEIQDMLSKQNIKTEDKGKFLVEMAVEKKPDAGDNITLILIEN